MENQEKQITKGETPKKESLWKWRGISILVGSTLLLAAGVAATARNALLQESAIQAKSERLVRGAASHQAAALFAPSGVDAGNAFITLMSRSGGSGTSLAPVFDPLRRIVKIVETAGGTVISTKQFVWDGNQLCEERDANGAVTRRFFANGEQSGGTNYYYTRDHLGSVREMTDGNGSIVASLSFDPYGRPTKLQGTGPEPSFGYAGMYVHPRSGLNLAVNRAYSAQLGRWISRDPIQEAGGLNLYAYANGNPISFSDPSGLVPGMCPIRPPLKAPEYPPPPGTPPKYPDYSNIDLSPIKLVPDPVPPQPTEPQFHYIQPGPPPTLGR